MIRSCQALEEASANVEFLTKKLRVGDQLLGKQKAGHEALVNELEAKIVALENSSQEVRHCEARILSDILYI